MSLSPAAAAKIAGVSRSTISLAIKAGELKATLRNNKHNSIERADLDEWMQRRTVRDSSEKEEAQEPAAAIVTRHPDDIAAIEKLSADLATVREELAEMRGRLAVQADRLHDADQAQYRAEKRADELTAKLLQIAEKASEPRPTVGLLGRLFGRRG